MRRCRLQRRLRLLEPVVGGAAVEVGEVAAGGLARLRPERQIR